MCATLLVSLIGKRDLTVIVAVIGVIALAVFRISMIPAPAQLKEGRAQLDVLIVDEPDRREQGTMYVAEVIGHSGLDLILVTLPRYPEYRYGDKLTLIGKIMYPEPFEGDQGRIFAYDAYLLATKQVSMLMRYPQVAYLGHEAPSMVREMLIKSKAYLLGIPEQLFVEPEQSLLAGMLFGSKQSLGKNLLEDFQHAGLVHIVVLSGYNMSVVASWFARVGMIFGYYGALLVSLLGLIAFAGMAGGGATVVRALIMASIAILARATGNQYALTRALLLAAAIMALHEPRILTNDPSFQLSFLATLGIIHVTPYVERFLAWIKFGLLREIVATTLATQVTVLPLLIYQTGMVSLLSLPANILALPFVPVAMLFGVLAVILGSMVHVLGMLLAIPAAAALSWITFIAIKIGEMNDAIVTVPSFPISLVLLSYLLLFLFLYSRHRLR